jgi:ribulose-phosphate 3-epimerase
MHQVRFFIYRYKFILLYTIIGFFSLCVEFGVIHFLASFNIDYPGSAIIALVAGILVAFYLNIQYNFHIVPSKRKKALFYFVLISVISFSFQYVIREQLKRYDISMDQSRFIISGLFFVFAYLLHRRFSFKEYKKVGVAIYANGIENIQNIYSSISNVSDFIHIDIVDQTFNPDCNNVKAYRAETIRAYWQNKTIEAHVMSRKPSLWLPELMPHVDRIYLHLDIDENLSDLIKTIKENGCKPGLAFQQDSDLRLIDKYIDSIENILILAIDTPGLSGQQLNMSVLNVIDTLNKRAYRNRISICVDGGVNQSTIQHLNVESVVSGSFVLSARDPVRNIMLLQTSGEYERF